jgi:integrase
VIQRLHNDLPYGLAYAATEQIEAWLGQPGWSRWTRVTYGKHIRMFYRWATSTGHLDGDPALNLPRPKAPRGIPDPVTRAELARALESPESWYTAIVLAAFAGLRSDEIGHAQREHVDQVQMLVPCGKGGDAGAVPTHPFLWGVVKDRPDGPLVLNRRGRPVTGRWLSANAREHFDRLGLPKVHLHRFRHYFGTMIQAGFGDLRVTQECMRHASISSTQGYTLVTGQQRASAIGSIPSPCDDDEDGTPAEL